MDSRGAVRNSDQYLIDGDQLIIKDACAISDGDGMSYRCGGVLPTGSIVMGEDHHVKPLGELVLFEVILCSVTFLSDGHAHTHTHKSQSSAT